MQASSVHDKVFASCSYKFDNRVILYNKHLNLLSTLIIGNMEAKT